MSASDKKPEVKFVKSASLYGKALVHVFLAPGRPSRRSLDAMRKHSLAMVRYDVRQKLAEEESDELLTTPIPNKGCDYVAIYREEKLRALLRKYKIDASSVDAFYLLSLQLATEFHPGFKAVSLRQRKRPQWSGTAGTLLVFLIEKIRAHSKSDRSTTSLIRELKRQFPKLYGSYSDQMLRVRYFEARRQRKAVR
jgi:hypothetical protein